MEGTNNRNLGAASVSKLMMQYLLMHNRLRKIRQPVLPIKQSIFSYSYPPVYKSVFVAAVFDTLISRLPFRQRSLSIISFSFVISFIATS